MAQRKTGTAILRAGLKYEGKTKLVWSMQDTDSSVIFEAKDDITAFDDPTKTQILPGKGEWCTATCSRVFELLMKNGLPTAFISQLSETEMICWNCAMIPLEVVVRNLAFGSFLKRFPRYAPTTAPNNKPVFTKFRPPRFELFLKTTKGRLEFRDRLIVDGLNPEAGEEDPWIPQPNDSAWQLWHPKKPLQDRSGRLPFVIKQTDILGFIAVQQVEKLALMVNEVLRDAWQKLGYTLVDFKIELGVTGDDQLVVADVIDADSWRLWDLKTGEDFSKQTFRDGFPLESVAAKYKKVAELAPLLR